MSSNPKVPGHEPDPDSTSPDSDLPDTGEHAAERIEETGEPFDGNFA